MPLQSFAALARSAGPRFLWERPPFVSTVYYIRGRGGNNCEAVMSRGFTPSAMIHPSRFREETRLVSTCVCVACVGLDIKSLQTIAKFFHEALFGNHCVAHAFRRVTFAIRRFYLHSAILLEPPCSSIPVTVLEHCNRATEHCHCHALNFATSFATEHCYCLPVSGHFRACCVEQFSLLRLCKSQTGGDAL